MARPEFSEVLIQRRRDLGLTTAQASRVLKLKEQVLISLEEGDFESIPKSGYAQGMVSSYARYLGLDAREVVDMFLRDLDSYEATTSHKNSRDNRRSMQRGILSSQRSTVDDSRRQLLPTAGGRAGDMGDFATTSHAQTRTNSVALVSSSRMRSQDRYEGSYSRYEDDDYELTSAPAANPRRVRTQVSGDLTRPRHSQRGSQQGPQRGSQRGAQRNSHRIYSNERISRSHYTEEYEDDRVAGEATRFEPAASPAGRRSSHRIPKAQRPGNAPTQRRASYGRRGDGSSQRRGGSSSRGRSRQNQNVGFEGALSFISESRAIIGVAALIIVILLMVVIFMGVKSCTDSSSSKEREGIPVSTTVSTTSTGTINETGQDASQTQQQGDAQATNPQADQTAQDAPQTTTGVGESQSQQLGAETSAQEPINTEEGGSQTQNLGEVISTEVTVSVMSGESTWLEILQDGESRIADQVLGPWSETYDVKESLTISADNTAAVSVFENGTSRSFENRASGVGSMTIKVPSSTIDTMNTVESGDTDVNTTTSN